MYYFVFIITIIIICVIMISASFLMGFCEVFVFIKETAKKNNILFFMTITF